MIRRALGTIMIVTMAALAVIGPIAAAQSNDVIELTFMHAFNHVNPDLQAEIVEEFNALHPGIRVTIETVEWNAPPELLSMTI